jgi:hypothetical protein
MFDPLNQNGDDEIDFSEKNLFEGLPVDEICKNTVDFPEEEFKKPEKGEEGKEEEEEKKVPDNLTVSEEQKPHLVI